MRWERGRRSSNVEDRRSGGKRAGLLGGGGLMTLVLVLVAMYFGVDPSLLLQEMPAGGKTSVPADAPAGSPAAPDTMRDFVSVVLADTEDTWQALFAEQNRRYQEPSLVLFSGQVSSACGMAWRPSGPSIVRVTARSISIWPSLRICATASTRPEISPRPM